MEDLCWGILVFVCWREELWSFRLALFWATLKFAYHSTQYDGTRIKSASASFRMEFAGALLGCGNSENYVMNMECRYGNQLNGIRKS